MNLKCFFYYRCLYFFIFIVILSSLIIPCYQITADIIYWDDNWPFSEEIIIPFDTRVNNAKFQPIDIRVDFQNPCWVKNEKESSIRVCCWDGKYWHELESQIYDLTFENIDFISGCNLIFLIPDFANGNERYFIFYADYKTPSSVYDDHVQVEESYYRYEPISGYPLKSDFFRITDDGYIVYAISYKGELMGYDTCQHVTKMKDGTLEVLPKNFDLFAAFDFKYWYEDGLYGYSSTSQKLVSKEILNDGNLMVEVGIISTSKLDDLMTTATYKYYHCPTSNKRIHTQVKHEALDDISVLSSTPEISTDGVFASLQSGGVKSESIQDLNIGEILPFLHFYNEYGNIVEYYLDIDPEHIKDNPYIRVISVEDDIDLGEKPWISFDEGESGVCHSIIFNSNNVITSNSDHKDGLQINVFEMDYPHLPGLENNMATIQIGRNSIEPNEDHNLKMPIGFTAEFDAEFFSSQNDGFPIIEEEFEIFQELVKIKPESNEIRNQINDDIEKNDLSVFVNFAPSIPMGSSLSALLGLNLSYITVELYKNNEFVSSESAVRIPMNAFEELEEPSFLERVISSLKIIDIINISILKKAVFNDLEEGKYVIKIFRENPFLLKEKTFIGYKIVDLSDDKKVNVVCRSESKIQFTILDQKGNGIKNAEIFLQKSDVTISKCLTNEKGRVTIKVPTDSEPYDLKIIYDSIIIYEEKIKLDVFKKVRSNEKIISIMLCQLGLELKDTWGLSPGVDLNFLLTIKQAGEPIKIRGGLISDASYIFKDLSPNKYYLTLSFKSFYVNKEVELMGDKELEVEFPAEFDVEIKVIDSRGLNYDNSKIIFRRDDKIIEIQNKEFGTRISIPPGEYQIKIFNEEDNLIGSRKIGVYGNQEYDMITNYEIINIVNIIIIGIIALLFISVFLFLKRKIEYILVILFILLVLFSLLHPWWEINGLSEQIETSTRLYLIPTNMVTITSTQNSIAGEISYLPAEFQFTMNLVIFFLVTSCLLLFLKQIFKNRKKTRYNKLITILMLLSVIFSISIFIFSMNELSRVCVGTIVGNGYLNLGAPGDSQIYSASSSWGFGSGFYFFLVSIFIIGLFFAEKKIVKFVKN